MFFLTRFKRILHGGFFQRDLRPNLGQFERACMDSGLNFECAGREGSNYKQGCGRSKASQTRLGAFEGVKGSKQFGPRWPRV